MANAPIAVFPQRGSSLGLLSLMRNSAALLSAVWEPRQSSVENLPRGDGRIVLVIPAFLSGDWATRPLCNSLSQLDYRVETANVGVNLGPTRALIAKLDAALMRLFALQGGPIDIVGQSLGGVLARDLASRHPDRIRRVVTLCSPIRIPITTPLAPAARLLAPLYDPHWMARREAIVGPLAVSVTALYSQEDGVVDWSECLQKDEGPDRVNVRVSGAHATIASSPATLAAIANALTA